MKSKFDSFIMKSVKYFNRHEGATWAGVFSLEDEKEKKLILQSIIDSSAPKFYANAAYVMEILPAFSREKPTSMKPLLGQVLQKIIKLEPKRIKDISPKILKEFSSEISEALEDNILVSADIVGLIPEENLEDFTEVINAIMQRSDIRNIVEIIRIIPNPQLSHYYETIKDEMLRSVKACKNILPCIPYDQVHNFYNSLKEVIKDNSYRAPEIIAVIPADKVHDFKEVILEMIQKHPDKTAAIIDVIGKGDLSHYGEEFRKVIRYKPEHAPAIISSMERAGKFKEIERNIWRVMIENPNRVDTIIQAVPDNKLPRFYDAIREVIKDDYKFNVIKGQNTLKILDAIPRDKLSNFYNILYEVIESDKQLNKGRGISYIINAIPKEKRAEFIIGGGKLLESVDLRNKLPKLKSMNSVERGANPSLLGLRPVVKWANSKARRERGQ